MGNLPLFGGGQPDMSALGHPGGQLFSGSGSSGGNWKDVPGKVLKGFMNGGGAQALNEPRMQSHFQFAPLTQSEDSGPGPLTMTVLQRLMQQYGNGGGV